MDTTPPQKPKFKRVSVNTGGNGMSLQEVADVMGYTKERIRQIEALALRKMASVLRKRGIDLDDIL